MIALVSGILLVGYTLVYAAVANGGKLAERPWDAFRVDAYSGELGGQAGGAGGGSGGGGIGGALRGGVGLLPLPGPIKGALEGLIP